MYNDLHTYIILDALNLIWYTTEWKSKNSENDKQMKSNRDKAVIVHEKTWLPNGVMW